jgi:nucleoside 2-deoxyribosyltransferase
LKIYIAAKYARRYELRLVAEQLREMGHECTSQWIDNGEESKGQTDAALMDIADVMRADAVLFIAEPYRSQNTGGGRYFELGYAYASGKAIYIVQPGELFETVFHALPGFVIEHSIPSMLKRLQGVGQ